jgi:hypothetical protein
MPQNCDGDVVGEWLGVEHWLVVKVIDVHVEDRSITEVVGVGLSFMSLTRNGSWSKMVLLSLEYTLMRCSPIAPRLSITTAMHDTIFLKAPRRIEYFRLIAQNRLWGQNRRNLG